MIKENVKPVGELTLKVFDKNGELVEFYREKNLIVNGGREQLSKLLAGSGVNRHVSAIGFGTSGTAADATDAALTGAVTKAFSSVTYPETNSVQFNFTLEYAEGNGTAIREFGLVCANGTLFSRRTRDLITKTSDLKFEGNWKIIFNS